MVSSSRVAYFAYRVTSWIPTASVVRYYTVTQSLLWLLWFPLILSGNLECLLLSLCTGGEFETRQLDTYSLVNRLYGSNASFDRIPLSMMSTQCSLTLFLHWNGAPANRLNRLQTLWCIVFFFCCFHFFSYYRLWATQRIESIG